MPIRIRLDDVLAARGMRARQVAAAIGVSETHLSLFRSGKVRGVRFATLAKLCAVLDCQPGDLLVYEPSDEHDATAEDELDEAD
ncbi:MAG: helix-turn-helix transcriptional regulator [Rhodanobacteraceae bacterium]